MRVKKDIEDIKNIGQRICYKLKRVWWLPFVLFIVLTCCIWKHVQEPNINSKYYLDSLMIHMLPFGVILWGLVLAAPYIQEDGRELLYFRCRFLQKEMVFQMLFYQIMMSVEYVVFYREIMNRTGISFLIYLKYIIYIFCMAGFVYALVFLCHSVLISELVAIFLYIMELLAEDAAIPFYSVFNWNYSSPSFLAELLILAGTGIILWGLGIHRNNTYCTYDE